MPKPSTKLSSEENRTRGWEKGISVEIIGGGPIVKGIKHGGKAAAGIIKNSGKSTKKPAASTKPKATTTPSQKKQENKPKPNTTQAPAGNKKQTTSTPQNGNKPAAAKQLGTGQATVIRSTEDSINRINQIRQEFSVGSKRNIAFAEYEVNGKKGELIGVSGNAERVGTVGVPENRIFDTITTGNNPRTLDSEVKILESLASKLSQQASGKVYLFSELPFCISCAGVIEQFKKRFPNIDVIIDHGPGGRK